MTVTNKSLFVKRVIKTALKTRRGEFNPLGSGVFTLPMNYIANLQDGDRFKFENGTIVTFLDVQDEPVLLIAVSEK